MCRCGITRQEEGVLSAVVVVQHHPVLQRKGDKVPSVLYYCIIMTIIKLYLCILYCQAVQLLCYFAAQDKVVTNNYDVLAE